MENRIIIDCNIENVAEIVKQGLDVKMMDEYMVREIMSFALVGLHFLCFN